MEEIKDRFHELVQNKDWKLIKQELNILEPFQIAEIIEVLDEPDAVVLFRLLPRAPAKETFQYLSHEQQEDIIESLATNSNQIASLLNDLDPDDRTAFFEELPGKVSQRLVQMLSSEEREIATRLLGYPEESIGRLMTPEYVAIKPYFTVAQ
ncbi:MAG: magnesium transporter, partial [Tannerella sp.]|nr:magnesium transporter [Tannerella sp.]